jgi:hypothetical protein
MKIIEKHIPADPQMNRLWLINRQPEDWRDKHEVTGADGTPLEKTIIILPNNMRDSEQPTKSR